MYAYEVCENVFCSSSGTVACAVHPTLLQPEQKADRDQVEDKIRQLIDGWTEEEQATAYLYLYASGMDLEKAKKIRRRAGFST